MKVGDLVKNLSSESGMLGIVVSFDRILKPVVRWMDGRLSWCHRSRMQVVK